MNWNKYPFIRLFVALALGVALHEIAGTPGLDRRWLWGALAVLVIVLVVLHHVLRSYRCRWVHGVAVILAFIYVGYFRACLQEPDCRHQLMGYDWCLARLYEPPVEREKTVKVVLEVVGLKTEFGNTRVNAKSMAYFQKTDKALGLGYGDLLAFQVPVEPVTPPMNPGEFDYRKYLERRGVTGSVFLKEGDWIPLGMKRTNALFEFAYRSRDQMMRVMEQCGVTGDELAVGAAILLGYDESLPAQVRHNYVAAGAMHILCVSGMHVGVIYLLASFLLGLLGKGKGALLVKRITLLGLIWLYALITGLSPSIMRSALMISMVLFGEIIHRKGFTLNSIAASAFVLLMVDPNNLFAIGFQLSYVAVTGIVLLQKQVAVSVAAQIATMPFTVFYFNQFTPYFWLSNLLTAPLSFVVILSGMLLLAVSWVPGLNLLVGKVFWWGLHVMNGVVSIIERLPFSLVKGLSMNGFQFGISLVLLLLLWLFVNLRKKRMMMEMLVLAAVFAFSLAWRSQRLAHQSSVTVYSLRNHTAIAVTQGFNSVLLCDRDLLSEPSSIDYSLRGHWAERQLTTNPPCFTLDEDFRCPLAFKRKNLLSAQGKLFAFWDPDIALDTGIKVEVDYLLVHGRQKPDLRHALKAYQIHTLLLDGSVPEFQVRDWMLQAEAFGIPVRNLRDGAVLL